MNGLELEPPVSGTSEKDQLWKIYCLLSQEQRHFNGVQEKYRLMASSWVLGTVAASGFVLSTDTLFEHKWLIIGAIGMAACLGLIVLWYMDVHFYQKLLNASYEEALSMEKEQYWLPQVRDNIRTLMKGKGPSIVSRFYLFGVAVSGVLATSGLGVYFFEIKKVYGFVAGAIVTLFVLVSIVRTHMTPKENLELSAEIQKARRTSYAQYSRLFESNKGPENIE